MRIFVAALLVLAGLAAAQGGGYQDPAVTECWECHAPGRDPTPMTPAFAVNPGLTEFNAETTLQPRIVNTWLAEVSQMTLEVDLSAAPGLSFIGGREPSRNETAGTLTIDHSDTTFVLREHRANVPVEVPAGASGLRISLSPDDVGPLGPDLSMTVTGAASEKPFARIDQAGAGGTEVLILGDPASIAAQGAGTWHVEAGLRPTDTQGHLDPQLAEARFTVTVEAWFNTSLERVMVLDAPGAILPGTAQAFTIPVLADGVQPGESVTFTSRARLFYEHGNQNADEAFVVYTETFVVGADDQGSPILGTQSFVAPLPEAAFALATVSEAVGYGAAFLMVASILSGGILGKGSRRAMNRLFLTARRRVAFHNFLSYGILAAAFAHLILFLIEVKWHWAWGLLWGGLGILSLFALGFTGALQVPIIRRWGFGAWRWIHFGMALAAILFTVIHILLDGSHFEVRDAIGWTDPFVPDGRQ